MQRETSRLDDTAQVSPCMGMCRMDASGLCIGCRRTLAEIARWSSMNDDDRRRWMREEQPLRPSPRA